MTETVRMTDMSEAMAICHSHIAVMVAVIGHSVFLPDLARFHSARR